MRTQIVAFLLSLGVSALLTPFVLRVAKRFKLYDDPDGIRKIHTGQISRLGGIAIAVGFLAPLIGLLFYTNVYTRELKGDEFRLTVFLVGIAAIIALGLYDDLKGCGAIPKLLVQGLVGALLWYGGISFENLSIFDHTIAFGWLSLPMTMLWVAGVINAMNLIDGLDGLAGGVAFFAAISLFSIAWIDGDPILALFGSALAGSVLGFLLYNFSPAMIFMGDTGSMMIGYAFAAAALWSANKRTTAMAMLLPALALGLPLFDTIYAFLRRIVQRRSPFQSDREHIHHRLLDAGLSHRSAVLVLYGVCVALTLASVAIRSTDNPTYGVVVLTLATTIFIATRWMIRRSRRIREQTHGATPTPPAQDIDQESDSPPQQDGPDVTSNADDQARG